MRRSAAPQTDEVGDQPGPLVELDQAHQQRIVEARSLGMVGGRPAVEAAPAGGDDVAHVEAPAGPAPRRRREVLLAAGLARLDPQLVAPGPVPEELVVEVDARPRPPGRVAVDLGTARALRRRAAGARLELEHPEDHVTEVVTVGRLVPVAGRDEMAGADGGLLLVGHRLQGLDALDHVAGAEVAGELELGVHGHDRGETGLFEQGEDVGLGVAGLALGPLSLLVPHVEHGRRSDDASQALSDREPGVDVRRVVVLEGIDPAADGGQVDRVSGHLGLALAPDPFLQALVQRRFSHRLSPCCRRRTSYRVGSWPVKALPVAPDPPRPPRSTPAPGREEGAPVGAPFFNRIGCC